jgi:hypothetical protein
MSHDLFGYLSSGKNLAKTSCLSSQKSQKLKRKWKKLDILQTYVNSMEQSTS